MESSRNTTVVWCVQKEELDHVGHSSIQDEVFATLLSSLLGYALETAYHLLNNVPSKSIVFTPYKMWYGCKSSISHLQVWGCLAYIKRLDSDKLGPRSDQCLFVGYPKETKGYFFYNPLEQKVFVSRNATFLENEILSERGSGRRVELGEAQEPQIDSNQ